MAVASIKLNTNQINYINIGLMLVSAAVAFRFPFELFLFSYAFFGPLHYLTEISWLHDRDYFTGRKSDALFLGIISILITFAGLGGLEYVLKTLEPEYDSNVPSRFSTTLMFMAFGGALVFVLTKKFFRRLIWIFVIGFAGIILSTNNYVESFCSVLLPTIIHVFIFTGFFILMGALRGGSLSGIISLGVFVACAASFYIFPHWFTGYHISDYAQKTYPDGFNLLNFVLMSPFKNSNLTPQTIREYIDFVNNALYQSTAAFAVMGFIAFAYTYHYLNWFSKTSIIQWHAISRTRLTVIVCIWLASIGLYYYDYAAGLQWLFLLSFAHVLLEFPLNHQTFIGIWKKLTSPKTT